MILFNVFETKVGQLIYVCIYMQFIDWNKDYTSYNNRHDMNQRDNIMNTTTKRNINIYNENFSGWKISYKKGNFIDKIWSTSRSSHS